MEGWIRHVKIIDMAIVNFFHQLNISNLSIRSDKEAFLLELSIYKL